MSELQTTPRLSLFQIAGDLLGLIYQRQDAEDRLAICDEIQFSDTAEEVRAEIRTCDALIKQYVEGQLATKSDSYAFVIKEFKAREKARKQAADELRREAERDKEVYERLQQTILSVMQELGLPEINGNVHRITRQGNGGVQALTIAQPDLVPKKFRTVTVTMTEDVFDALPTVVCTNFPVPGFHESYILAELQIGNGVPGCRLEPRGEHIRIK